MAARGRVPLRAPGRALDGRGRADRGPEGAAGALPRRHAGRARAGSATCCASTSPSTSRSSRRRDRALIAPCPPAARLRPQPGPPARPRRAGAADDRPSRSRRSARSWRRSPSCCARRSARQNRTAFPVSAHRQRRACRRWSTTWSAPATASSAACTALFGERMADALRARGAEVVARRGRVGPRDPDRSGSSRRPREPIRRAVRRARRDVDRRRAAARRARGGVRAARRAAARRLRHLARRAPARPRWRRRRRRVQRLAEVPQLPAWPRAVHGQRPRARAPSGLAARGTSTCRRSSTTGRPTAAAPTTTRRRSNMVYALREALRDRPRGGPRGALGAPRRRPRGAARRARAQLGFERLAPDGEQLHPLLAVRAARRHRRRGDRAARCWPSTASRSPRLGPLAGQAWRIGVMGEGARPEPQERLVARDRALSWQTRPRTRRALRARWHDGWAAIARAFAEPCCAATASTSRAASRCSCARRRSRRRCCSSCSGAILAPRRVAAAARRAARRDARRSTRTRATSTSTTSRRSR